MRPLPCPPSCRTRQSLSSFFCLHSSLSAYASILETGPVPPLFISQRQHARRIRVLCISPEYEPGQTGDLQKVPTSSRPYIGQFSWRQPIAGNASFASCQAAPSPPPSLVRSFVRSCWTPEKVRTARTVCDSRAPPPGPAHRHQAISSQHSLATASPAPRLEASPFVTTPPTHPSIFWLCSCLALLSHLHTLQLSPSRPCSYFPWQLRPRLAASEAPCRLCVLRSSENERRCLADRPFSLQLGPSVPGPLVITQPKITTRYRPPLSTLSLEPSFIPSLDPSCVRRGLVIPSRWPPPHRTSSVCTTE